MATQELRDLKSLFDDGILDEDEYEEKLAEINAAAPPPKKKKQAPPKKKAKAKAEKEGYEGLSVAKLKAALKERGLSQTGEKGTLIWRLKLQDRGGAATLADGRSPFALKVGELKKQAAKVGVSPMGTNDEMLEGLVDALLKANPGASAAAAPADAGGGGGSDGADAREVATRVLELAESDDWESILSLGAPGSKLGALSPLSRRAGQCAAAAGAGAARATRRGAAVAARQRCRANMFVCLWVRSNSSKRRNSLQHRHTVSFTSCCCAL